MEVLILLLVVIAFVCIFKGKDILKYIDTMIDKYSDKAAEKSKNALETINRNSAASRRQEMLDLIKSNTVNSTSMTKIIGELRDRISELETSVDNANKSFLTVGQLSMQYNEIKTQVRKYQTLIYGLTKYLELVTHKSPQSITDEANKISNDLITRQAMDEFDKMVSESKERLENQQKGWKLAFEDFKMSLENSKNHVWNENSKYYTDVMDKLNKLADAGVINKDFLKGKDE